MRVTAQEEKRFLNLLRKLDDEILFIIVGLVGAGRFFLPIVAPDIASSKKRRMAKEMAWILELCQCEMIRRATRGSKLARKVQQ